VLDGTVIGAAPSPIEFIRLLNTVDREVAATG